MKIYIENSSWLNIGDFFYQESIFNIFKEIFTAEQFKIKCFDAPIKRSFKINNKFFLKNAFELRNYLDGDIYVLSGPILGEEFINSYGKFIETIKSNGKEYLILSAHGKDISENKKFLEKYPPLAISTRSSETYKIYNSFSKNSFDGICNAFFLPIYLDVPNFIYPKYILKSFYSTFEPKVKLNLINQKIDLENISLSLKKKFLWKISRHFNFLTKNEDQLEGFNVIRPIHDLSYKFHHLNFAKKNSYISYNISNYLSVYKSSDLVISDRIHSVVIGLSLNIHSDLCGNWDRATLLDRLKLKKINNCYLPPEKKQINNELENYKNWLRSIIK